MRKAPTTLASALKEDEGYTKVKVVMRASRAPKEISKRDDQGFKKKNQRENIKKP